MEQLVFARPETRPRSFLQTLNSLVASQTIQVADKLLLSSEQGFSDEAKTPVVNKTS